MRDATTILPKAKRMEVIFESVKMAEYRLWQCWELRVVRIVRIVRIMRVVRVVRSRWRWSWALGTPRYILLHGTTRDCKSSKHLRDDSTAMLEGTKYCNKSMPL